jgi:hypothetical protein
MTNGVSFLRNRQGMIVARVVGGLGNQLFVYAAARGFSSRTGRELQLDLASYYKRDPYARAQALGEFNTISRTASPLRCFDYPGGRIIRKVVKLVNRCLPVRSRTYLYELDLPASTDLLSATLAPYVYLDGYWQNHSYFEHIESDIRAELTLKVPPSPWAMALDQTVSAVCSVAVHLRGLYGVSATGRRVADLATLPGTYYRAAIELARSKLTSPKFFIFTDGADPKPLLQLCPDATVISRCPGQGPDYEDLWVMSRCRHHIVAHSTFSWWAAWLQPQKPHLVLSPNMPRYGQRMTVPKGWVVVDV